MNITIKTSTTVGSLTVVKDIEMTEVGKYSDDKLKIAINERGEVAIKS